MSIRVPSRGGNARRLVDSILLAFPRNPVTRAQLLFAALKVAAPIALVVALLLAAPHPDPLLAASALP